MEFLSLIDGTMSVADYQSARLLKDRYHRLAPELPEAIGFDDVSKSLDLEKWSSEGDAARKTEAAADWLRKTGDARRLRGIIPYRVSCK